jgi:hypothetical protein
MVDVLSLDQLAEDEAVVLTKLTIGRVHRRRVDFHHVRPVEDTVAVPLDLYETVLLYARTDSDIAYPLSERKLAVAHLVTMAKASAP